MEYIRQTTAQDLPYLYEISLRTALAGLDGTDYYHDPFCAGHYNAAPYFFFEPSLCFTAVDGYNRPSGYIAGTSDTGAFNTWMNSTWLPPLKQHYMHVTTFKSQNEKDMISLIIKGPGEGVWEHVGYPAHLHINLLGTLQGKGLGKALMLTFMETVQKTGVAGIHLNVDGRNPRVFGFYENMGFTKLKQPTWGTVFGLKF